MDPEDQDVSEAAAREAELGYGAGAYTQPMRIPAPPQYTPTNMDDPAVLKAMNMDPISMFSSDWGARSSAFRQNAAESEAKAYAANASAYRSYIQAAERQQAIAGKAAEAQAKAQDPVMRAQRMYTMAGSLGGARTIAKSTGPALFQLGEVIEIAPDMRFGISPTGVVMVPGKDGKPVAKSMAEALWEGGVSVVPYLGGDEEAKGFRMASAKTAEVVSILAQMEEIVNKAGAKSIPLTDAKQQLEQLESGLPSLIQALRTGSKSMAGVSDKELEAIERGIPRPSEFWRSDKDARNKVAMTRRQLTNMLIRQARANGIELNPMKDKQPVGPNASQGRAANQIIPGINLSPNGKQSGAPVTAQPR
jgi:hypothetical protein